MNKLIRPFQPTLFGLGIALSLSLLSATSMQARSRVPEASQSLAAATPNSPTVQAIQKQLFSPNGAVILTAVVGLIWLNRQDGGRVSKKNRLATAQWAGKKEKRAARRLAHRQINDRRRNAVTLFVVKPQLQFLPTAVSKPGQPTPTEPGATVVRIKDDTKTLWLTEAQSGTAVVGGPGTGKTHSIIDPSLRSVIDQGFPLILYDFKYPIQSERIAGVAAKAGYEVRVFAPGFPESDVCNPLDFIRDIDDVEMARQIAIVLNRNFKPGTQTVEDPFFTNSGDQLIQAVLLLAKSTPYPDIITCAKALGAPNLAARMQAADLPTWIETSFGQLISMADSEKTVASVISTASILFSRFMSPTILSVFCGTSTIPLTLSGKQLLILGMDQERRDVVAPLLATVLHMIVTKNANPNRKDPLVLALDELPTLYIPDLVKWINEFREYGLSCLLGFQNLAQLEKVYGRETARAIFGGCAGKVIFNPQEYESADVFSKFLGEEHLQYKGRSRSIGGKGGASTSISQQERTRKLFAPEQFLRLPQGTCILLNRGYSNKDEISLPLRCTIKIPKADTQRMEMSQAKWQKVKARLIKKSSQTRIDDAAMRLRKEYFLETYPLEKKVDPNVEETAAWAIAAGLL
ncbi:type IV secretory system conjugative DNA transfer family protein [Leptolyngbya sp. AN03gr2]|uniref:type IV secretory system conjugative DNA transfer family protein n=1 Tax=unclassified Leptolyngbya TaxID=2650499 RepID=UPI003D316CEA